MIIFAFLSDAFRCSTQDPNNNPGNENSLSKAERLFELRLPGLIQCLRRLFEQAPFARYYNVDVLKYQLNRSTGATSCPLQVVTHWKCELQSTCLKIDYKYNSNALSTFEPLRNVTFTATVDAQVIDMQSKPNAIWLENANSIFLFLELYQSNPFYFFVVSGIQMQSKLPGMWTIFHVNRINLVSARCGPNSIS